MQPEKWMAPLSKRLQTGDVSMHLLLVLPVTLISTNSAGLKDKRRFKTQAALT
jgi:hypothetical protein